MRLREIAFAIERHTSGEADTESHIVTDRERHRDEERSESELE